MVEQRKRPDVYSEDILDNGGPIRSAKTGIASMMAVTEKGPIGIPVRHTSFSAWQRTFGGFELPSRGDAAYEAKMYFDEGGSELITVRVAHYSNVNNKDSFVGGTASRSIPTEGVSATAAQAVSAVGPFQGKNADALSFSVNGVAKVITLAMTKASVIGSALTGNALTGNNLQVRIGAATNPVQVVVFGSELSVEEVAATLNAGLVGCSVKANTPGTGLALSDDTQGTASRVEIVGGTALADLGLAIGVSVGTGNVANGAAIKATELVAIASDPTVTALSNGSLSILSPTTGPASVIILSPCTLLAPLGFTAQTLNGTSTGATFSTLKVESGSLGHKSPGVRGNSLKVKATQTPKHVSFGVGSDLAANIAVGDTDFVLTSQAGLNVGSVIKVWDATNTEYFEVTEVGSRFISGSLQFFVKVAVAAAHTYLATAAQVQSREFKLDVYEDDVLVETKESLSMLDTSDDYVVTRINDESLGSRYLLVTDLNASCGLGADLPASDLAPVSLLGGTSEVSGLAVTDWIGSQLGGTGLFALQAIDECMPFCTVGENSAAVVHAAAAYAKKRVWLEYITFCDNGMSGADAVAFRQNILGLNSDRAVLYAGGARVFDPIGKGSNPRRDIIGLGGLMALRGRVDALPAPNGGPWQVPGGEGEYGTLYTSLDVATKYDDDDAGEMNVAGINVIRKFGPTQNPVVMGGRTLDSSPNGEFKYVNVRRFFNFAEYSIVKSTRWSVLRNNDFRLWSRLKDAVEEWLEEQLKKGAFPSSVKSQAFFVKVGVTDGVMSDSDKSKGNVIGMVGLAANEPGEFIIWQFTQFKDGTNSVEEQ